MFALQPSKTSKSSSTTLQPNILPCKIHLDGPVTVSSRHWSPVTDEDKPDLATAYFRGRKLRGRKIALPEGYHGVVVTPTDKKLNPSEQRGDGTLNGQQNGCEEDEDDEDDEPPATILEPQGTFSNLMVWDHERLPAAEDSFVKGINEWIRFAEAMNSDSSPTESK